MQALEFQGQDRFVFLGPESHSHNPQRAKPGDISIMNNQCIMIANHSHNRG